MAAYDVEIEAFPFPVAAVEAPTVPIEVITPDTVAPLLTVISPPEGSQITSTATITFDVTDNEALRDTMVWVEHAGTWEVIWGGELAGFAPGFAPGSTRSSVSGGYRYQVQRVGGWLSSPIFHALVFDQSGNQV